MNFQSLRRSHLLVLHPDPIVCAGIAAALREHAAFEVSIHGADHALAERPQVDVVITDYVNAMRLTQSHQRRELGLPNDARILALTANDREADIRRAIEGGVYGYVLVGGPVDELVAGVKAVASGLRYMSASVAQRMADSLTRAPLTSRELEVLCLVVKGQPNKSIARQLSIELGTVKSHVSAIMAKLGAASRTQAARIASARGLVEEGADSAREPMLPRMRQFEPSFQYA
ncbi:MAG TPA: response regulator transcription factor [Ramlibacter sp.]|jgi:DNA-binding NarL/FixJ family response regulator|nr:response regulator transcription factor [Ramlibacter sp.]